MERVEVLQTTRGSSLTNTSEEIDVQVHVSNGDAKEQDTGPSAVVGWSESMDAVTKPGDHHGTFSRVATEALGKFVIARRVGILFFSAVSVLIASAVVANGLVVAETPPLCYDQTRTCSESSTFCLTCFTPKTGQTSGSRLA